MGGIPCVKVSSIPMYALGSKKDRGCGRVTNTIFALVFRFPTLPECLRTISEVRSHCEICVATSAESCFVTAFFVASIGVIPAYELNRSTVLWLGLPVYAGDPG